MLVALDAVSRWLRARLRLRRRTQRPRQRTLQPTIALARIQRVELGGIRAQRGRALHGAFAGAQERARGLREQHVGAADAGVGRRRRVGGLDDRPHGVAEARERVGRVRRRRRAGLDQRRCLLPACARDERRADERVRP